MSQLHVHCQTIWTYVFQLILVTKEMPGKHYGISQEKQRQVAQPLHKPTYGPQYKLPGAKM